MPTTYTRRRKRLYRTAKLTRSQLRAAYTLYRAGLSLHDLAACGWHAWGYASEESCRQALYGLFRREGYELRARCTAIHLARARARDLEEQAAAA